MAPAAVIVTTQVPAMKLNLLVSSCPIRKPLFHGEGPPPEPLLVPAMFNGEFIHTVPEESSIYMLERGKFIFKCESDFNRVPRPSMRCSARMFIIGNTATMVPTCLVA